jgi:hypothetical protein
MPATIRRDELTLTEAHIRPKSQVQGGTGYRVCPDAATNEAR